MDETVKSEEHMDETVENDDVLSDSSIMTVARPSHVVTGVNTTKSEFKTIRCDVCHIFLNSSSQAQAHFNGRSHQNKTKATAAAPTVAVSPSTPPPPPPPPLLKCELCQRTFNSESQLESHVSGKAHQLLATSKVEGLSTSTQPPCVQNDDMEEAEKPASFGSNVTNVFHCARCDITLNSQKQMEQHNKGLRHKIVIGKAKAPQMSTGEKWENVRNTKIANAILGINKDTITGSGGGLNLRQFYCEKCNITVNSQMQLDQHLQSQKHEMKGAETNSMKSKRKREFDGGSVYGKNKYQQPVPFKKYAMAPSYHPTQLHNFVRPTAINFAHDKEQFDNDGYYTREQDDFKFNRTQYRPEKFSQSWNHNFIY